MHYIYVETLAGHGTKNELVNEQVLSGQLGSLRSVAEQLLQFFNGPSILHGSA